MPKTYKLATDSWKQSEKIKILSHDHEHIALFPVSFLRASGDDTWSYIAKVVRTLVQTQQDLPCRFTNSAGQVFENESAPEAGSYTFSQEGAFEALAVC